MQKSLNYKDVWAGVFISFFLVYQHNKPCWTMENTKKYTNYEIEVKDLQTFWAFTQPIKGIITLQNR